MATVTMRELRNHGREVIDRVERGETLVVTRDGRPVAELRPLRRRPLTRDELMERWRDLPDVDVVQFRADIDELIDQSLDL